MISHRYGNATLLARGAAAVPQYSAAERWALLEASERRDAATALSILEAQLSTAAELTSP